MAFKGSTVNNVQNQCSTTCRPVQCWKWDVTEIIQPRRCPANYAVLVLNRPITQSPSFIKDFWNNALVRITVDGGTVQWDKYLQNYSIEDQNSIKIPDLITGDFDSISQSILKKYTNKGCKVINTPDQDHTDFTKALIELNSHCIELNAEVSHVVAIGQASGRIDQILGNVQTMFLAKQMNLLNESSKLYLMTDDAVSWLLFPGDHVITVPEETRGHARAWCSLVPVGEPCRSVSSSGLKWDLDNQPLKFGELVSTSNTFSGSETVKIKCSNTLLWSMKLPSIFS